MNASARRRFIVPEVVQTSSIDCGPAALACLAKGLGLPVSYGRLREACQTDVDGTSIDTLEEIAIQLGLDAEQVLLPLDHLLVPDARVFPAIVVARHASGMTHMIVAWRRFGPLVQVMDPSTGRRWLPGEQFLEELYAHTAEVPADEWRRWAGGEEYLAALRYRLDQVGCNGTEREHLIARALEDTGWRSIAALDGAARMVRAFLRFGAVRPGRGASDLLNSLFNAERAARSDGSDERAAAIPPTYWPALPVAARRGSAPGDKLAPAIAEESLLVRGAVLLRVHGIAPGRVRTGHSIGNETAPEQSTSLPPALAPVLDEHPAHPAREILVRLRESGGFTLGLLLFATILAAGAVLIEALLFRALLGEAAAARGMHGAGLAVAALALFAVLLLLEAPLALGLARMGRHLEIRLRIAFLEKLPRLGHRYFRSRPVSDMSERAHSLHVLRLLPGLGGNLLRLSLQYLFTTAALIWLDPADAALILAAAALGLVLPLVAQRLLAERELRVRSHLGALGRFSLDALLGLVPVRTHGAERALRREHQGLLTDWVRAGLRFQSALISVRAVQGLFMFGLVFGLLWSYRAHGGEGAGVLLVAYWALALSALGEEISRLLGQIPLHQNVVARLIEPLSSQEEESFLGTGPSAPDSTAGPLLKAAPVTVQPPGAAVSFENVTVRLGGRTVLDTIELSFAPGEHVALVGPSGAGKSTLAGCLLGWNRPMAGCLRIDGLPLDGERLARLRRETVWLDANVRLWNRSFLENLRYGNSIDETDAIQRDAPAAIERVLEDAGLEEILRSLPDGLGTSLGEAGALVSGGEGQRVRFGRALLRKGVRLAILDEPFRGLSREQRKMLLARARSAWSAATLLCITHDLEETQEFDRVIVLEDGRVTEEGVPVRLVTRPASRYRRLLEEERAIRREIWSSSIWRRCRVNAGRLEPAE